MEIKKFVEIEKFKKEEELKKEKERYKSLLEDYNMLFKEKERLEKKVKFLQYVIKR